MIDIINAYEFKRNRDNTVVYPISELAGILGLQPYLAKEHYFYCVIDECFAEGEFHTEKIVNGEIEVYLSCFAIKALIDSLKREGFKIDEFQAGNVLEKILETQSIVSECFNSHNGFNDYKDPIRKINPPFVKDIKYSLSLSDEATTQ